MARYEPRHKAKAYGWPSEFDIRMWSNPFVIVFVEEGHVGSVVGWEIGSLPDLCGGRCNWHFGDFIINLMTRR